MLQAMLPRGYTSMPKVESDWRETRESSPIAGLLAFQLLSLLETGLPLEGIAAADGDIECDIVGRHLLDGLGKAHLRGRY